MAAPKVIHWVHTKNWGGLEKFVVHLSDQLNFSDINSIVVFSKKKQKSESFRIAKFQKKIFIGLHFDILSFARKKEKLIIIHYTGSTMHWAPFIYCLSANIVQIRVFMHSFSDKKDFYHRFTYKFFNGFVFPTKASADKALTRLPIEKKDIYFQYFGVFLKEKKENNLDKIIITSMSRIEKAKCIFELVSAFDVFFSKFPKYKDFLVLKVYGKPHEHDFEGWNILKKISEISKNHEKNILICGHSDTPERVLANSSYLIFTSRNEFYGFSLIESFSVGVPAITVNRGSFSELNHNNCGFFIDIEDQKKFEEKIIEICSMKKEFYQIKSKNSYERYLDLFTIEDTTNLFIRYLNVVGLPKLDQ